MAASLRTSIVGIAFYQLLQRYLVPPLDRSGLTPNQLTVVGTGISFLVPFGFALHPVFGLIALLASGVADALDGLMARQRNAVSSYGAFLDSSSDRLSDGCYLIGFWLLLWPHPFRFWATLLMLAALMATLMISYVKARGEALGAECPVGIMERALRVLFLIAWALLIVALPGRLTGIVWVGFVAYTALSLATVLQRMIHIRRALMDRKPAGCFRDGDAR